MSPELAMTLMEPVQNSPKGRSHQTFCVVLVLIPDFLRRYYVNVISDSDEHTNTWKNNQERRTSARVTTSPWLVRHLSRRECGVQASDRGSIPEIRQYKIIF